MAVGDGLNNAKKNAQDLNRELEETEGKFRGLRGTLENINAELGKKINRLADARKSYTSLTSIASQLQNQEEGLTRLSDKKLDNLAEQAAIKQREIEYAADNLAIEKTLTKTGKSIFDLNKGAFETALLSLKAREKLTEEEEALIRGKKEGFEIEKNTVKAVQEEVDKRKQANKSLGLAGALTKTLASVGGEVAKAMNIDQVAKDMQDFADKTATATTRASKLQVLGEGIKSAYRNLGEGLSDPLVMFNFLLGAANSTSQRITNLQRQLGASYGEASRLNIEMQMTAAASGDLFITTEKLAKTFGEITNELGMSAEILGSNALVTATKLTNELGLSAKEATNLTVMARLQGEETDKVGQNIYNSVNSLNKQNKGAINAKAVLNDVANTTATISARLGENPEKIASAATQARLLGLNLEGVNQIADSLLNFESSISAELEAELLTGKQLNLEKARELALQGDLEGVGKEIAKQDAIKNAFANKNVIAQKAIAKSLGISVDQLAQMNRQQELNNLTAEQFKAKYGEQAFEAAMAKSAQEKFNATLDKVKAILGGIGTALAPILDGLVFILDNPIAPYFISALIAMKAMKAMKLGSMFGNMAKGAKSALASVKDIAKASKSKGGEGIGAAIKNKLGLGKTSEEIEKSKDKTKGIKPNAGGGVKSFLRNLSNGLKSMSGGKVLQGALNLIPTALGFVAMLPAIPSLLFFGLTPLKQLESNFASLANGLNLMSGTFVGSAALGAFGIAATLAIPSLIFLAGISLIGPAARVGLNALGSGLMGLGTFAATGIPFLGIGLIAALGGAMIPFAIAMNFAAPAIEAVGSVILSVFTGISTVITAVADGFTKMFESLNPENIGALLVLGPALLGISAGLAAISVTGLLAMPTILALTALGTVAEGLGSIFGGGGESSSTSEEGSLKAVENKLDRLIAAVEQGGDVFLDGNKVGKSLQLASSKIG